MKRFVFLFVMLLCATAFTASWRIPLYVSENTDSMKIYLYTEAGVIVDSQATGPRTSVASYDTILTVDNDTAYWADVLIYFTGEDSVARATYHRAALAIGAGGTGPDTLKIRAVDTTGADNNVANAQILAVSPGGTNVAFGTTDDSGLVLFELDADVTYSITGMGPDLQQWNNPTSMTNTAGVNYDTLLGWSISTAAPAATKTAAVLVILKDASGAAAEGINVSAYLIRSNLTDSSGAGVVNVPQNIKTNAAGIATFTCRWSSYLIPATKWRFQAHVPGSGGIRKDYTVPRVTVDTLNLAD